MRIKQGAVNEKNVASLDSEHAENALQRRPSWLFIVCKIGETRRRGSTVKWLRNSKRLPYANRIGRSREQIESKVLKVMDGRRKSHVKSRNLVDT